MSKVTKHLRDLFKMLKSNRGYMLLWTLVSALLLDPGSLLSRNQPARKNAPGTILDSAKSSRGKKKR
ncbi:unnamed protein product [Larinioides sclopetarius]|uniref:Uncharacterized protein n=1 Tax=Larinioides sclopetarius TaxID=280406 RepID=A0AAV1YW36_9ARAC